MTTTTDQTMGGAPRDAYQTTGTCPTRTRTDEQRRAEAAARVYRLVGVLDAMIDEHPAWPNALLAEALGCSAELVKSARESRPVPTRPVPNPDPEHDRDQPLAWANAQFRYHAQDRYAARPLAVASDDDDEAAKRAANRRMVARHACAEDYQPGKHRSGQRRGQGACRNWREQDPAAYTLWRRQREDAERQFTERDPRTGKKVTLAQYIARVRAGTWTWGTVEIAGVVVEVPFDPVVERAKHVNSRDARIEYLGRAAQRAGKNADGVQDALDSLRERPIWEPLARREIAPKAAHPEYRVWAGTEHDPADGWCAALDAQGRKTARIAWALRHRSVKARYAWLDRLLDAFSAPGDDPAFAALLIERVRDQDPTYLRHCLTQVANLHRRGRKAKSKASAAA